jgi:excisionase family DNA binding protein
VLSDLLSVPAAAARVGVSAKTIRRWIKAGHLPAVRTPGGHFYVAPAAVDAVLVSTDDQELAS